MISVVVLKVTLMVELYVSALIFLLAAISRKGPRTDSDYVIVMAVIPDVNVLKFTLVVKLLVLLSSFWLLLLVIGCMDNM